MKQERGISLIELVVVIFVIVMVMTIALANYRSFEKKTELDSYAQDIFAILKVSQTKTLASEKASQYGVHFENNKYILFKGDIYQVGAFNNEIHQLPSRLEIYLINLTGGGNDVVFKRINGTTDQDGAIGLRIINQPSQTKTITISPAGQIELDTSASLCCNTNQITDSRHIHLNLGWSIQNSTSLTLYFPDTPEVTININMANYFNGDKSEFDWFGIVDINGQNQELRIHSHFLDAVDTTLSIHRDRAKNNKPLQISIDGRDIISYTADGIAILGSFGGVMEIQ